MKYVLTAAGERYLARVNAQMIKMHLVRVEVGSGVSAAPEKLEALLDVKQRLQIESVEQDVNEAIIHCMLTNLELHEGYLLQQSGVYAHDSAANRDVLIFVGQDAEGERIPPIEEREVQYLHNIAVRVSSTDKITFDVSVSDFVRKDYLDQRLEEHLQHSGHIFVGAADTEIREGDVLLIMEGSGELPDPSGNFVVAAPTNLVISDQPPEDGTDNWGIVEGKMTVGSTPEEDTTFFGQI
ncbi:MAG: phage tail protein [Gallintestinimicrobium sp.]